MSIASSSIASRPIAAGIPTATGTTSSGAITEAADSVAGVSFVLVSSSGAITENPDNVHSTAFGIIPGASAAFKIIFGLLH